MYRTLNDCRLHGHGAASPCSWAVPAPARICKCPQIRPHGTGGFGHRAAAVPRAVLDNESATELITPAESSCSSNNPAAMLAAASLAASMAFAAAPASAVTVDTAAAPQQEMQQHRQSPVLQSVEATPALPTPDAPALVADSSEVLLEGMKEAVAGGLQEMSTNSMTAVGGPVAGEAIAAGLGSSSSGVTTAVTPAAADAIMAGPTVQQQQSISAAMVAAASSGGMIAPAAARPADCMLDGLYGMWQAYCHALKTSPLRTKVYTGIVGTLLGDTIAQVLAHHQALKSDKYSSSSSSSRDRRSKPQAGFRFDILRCGRLCLYSAAIGTPMGHYEYALLEAVVLPATPTAPAAVAAKVCLDQLVQTPFGMVLFFAVMKLLEGKPAQAKQEVQSKWLPGLLANWRLWPAAQLINFTVIPTEQRILFGNIVGVVWTCIISNMQQGSSRAAQAGGSSTGGSSSSNAAAPASGEAAAVNRPRTPMPA